MRSWGWGLPWCLNSKESACHAGAAGDAGSISGLGRSPWGGHGNPLQYSSLENPMGRGAWWATARGSQSQTWLRDRAFMHTRTGGWVPQDGISALIGRDLRDPLPLPATWGQSKKEANCKAGEDPYQKPDHAGTLILDFQPPELWELNAFCLSHSPWSFVTTAHADYDKYVLILHVPYSFLAPSIPCFSNC